LLAAGSDKRRNAVESSLFKQWLRNLQSEKGVLTYGRLSLTRVLIQVSCICAAGSVELIDCMTLLKLLSFASEFGMQGVDMFGKRVGFLKFKADIVDEETKTKVIGWNVPAGIVVHLIGS